MTISPLRLSDIFDSKANWGRPCYSISPIWLWIFTMSLSPTCYF